MIGVSLSLAAALAAAEIQHTPVGASADRPRVHQMHDIFQKDSRYAKLFSKQGASEICGPASMTNVVLWLKDGRKPGFKNLFRRVCEVAADKTVGNCRQRAGKGE